MATHRESPAIGVVLVDDRPIMRQGMAVWLDRASDIRVVGATGEARVARQLVEDSSADVVVVGLRFPDPGGVGVLADVLARCPDVGVLVLADRDEGSYLRALRKLGIRGYLPSSASGEVFAEAVRAVAKGGTFLETMVGEDTGSDRPSPITDRELQVLRLAAVGRRNAEIADALVVSIKTVEFHLGNLMSKLGARSRAEAVLRAVSLGLLLSEFR